MGVDPSAVNAVLSFMSLFFKQLVRLLRAWRAFDGGRDRRENALRFAK